MAESVVASVRISAGDPRRSYVLSRWVFLRLLGVVYLVAFWSLAVQVTGLVGENGILPVRSYLAVAKDAYGSAAYRLAPTLCWFSSSDAMLHGLALGGCALAILLILDVAPCIVLVLLWVFDLSLAVAGQVFLNFQWDALLLETGLLAIFYAPLSLRPRLIAVREPNVAGRWLLWLLVFKLMTLSGLTKLLSGDETWRNLSALTYHFQTQPLPVWTSWYAHLRPDWLHAGSTIVMYVIEIGAPCFIFVPSRWRVLRICAAVLMVLLQLGIAATGNYGFFNLLSIVLSLTLIDDGVWQAIWPGRWLPGYPVPAERTAWRRISIAAAVVLAPLSALSFVREIVYTLPDRAPQQLGVGDRIAEWIAPLRSVNGYGLFRVMTTRRLEIIIEGSDDGRNWQEYAFRYKPGDIARRPAWCAPHMPRLDWQMWFAALSPPQSAYWLKRLVDRLLHGAPEVTALLADGPFKDHPPRYVRLVMYEYRFASRQSDRNDWWVRKRIGELTPPLSLKVPRDSS